MYRDLEEVQERVDEHYNIIERLGYEVVACFAYGSWNYDGMSDQESDVDTKCWVLPKFEDIVLNKKPSSFTHITDNNEHIDVKDVRVYFELIKKQNPSFLEVLFSNAYTINTKYDDMVDCLMVNGELIAKYNTPKLLSACLGQIYEKQNSLTHRYEGIKEKIDKYGYDGKQLANAIRLLNMIQTITLGGTFQQSLNSSSPNSDYLISLKRNALPNYTKEDAVFDMKCVVSKARAKKEEFLLNYTANVDKIKEIDSLLDDTLMKMVSRYFGVGSGK